MHSIPEKQRHERMRAENPWWNEPPHQTDEVYRSKKPRAYFDSFTKLVEAEDVHRAVVLMGQRRVGKTVLLQHTIQKLLDKGVPPKAISYLSIDHPLYTNLFIEELVAQVCTASGLKKKDLSFLFLDEIQYLKNWEQHLKVFIDSHPNIKCVVSGSAAAALRLKSIESGAGRFTDFLLPPLTFYEYLKLQNIDAKIVIGEYGGWNSDGVDIDALNKEFIRYIQIGGYPETIFSEAIEKNIDRYVRNDIIDKVLARDLPSLYGIQDIQELTALFTTLAWHTAQEVSLDGLSQESGVSKPTIKRYIKYLEAAFLIKIVHRIDNNARRFKRIGAFKVYLTNPSIHHALFGQTNEKQEMGALVETAVFAQLFHATEEFHYACWKNGEVDIVHLDARQRPLWCTEVKWSDKDIEQRQRRGPLLAFFKKHQSLQECVFTTKTKTGTFNIGDRIMAYQPASVYCYALGLHITERPNT